MTKILSFPVKSFKRFDNPNNSKEAPAKYQFFISTKDIPSDLVDWLDVNPREQKLNTDVAKAIKASLENTDQNFHLLNRGILISAEEIKYDNVSKIATLYLSDTSKHGIVDGGHTFKIINDSNSEPDSDSLITKYVTVEVITNIEHIETLAEARNTSVAVDDKSIEELKGSFDVLKSILEKIRIGNDNFIERIAFKQNAYWGGDEKNIIDVREIIAIINMFNPYLYKTDQTPHPIQSYTGKEVSLSKFIKLAPTSKKSSKGEKGSKEFRDKIIIQMSNVIPDIFVLWDKIEFEFPEVSKEIKRRYGSKHYSNYNNDRVKKISTFSNKPLEYSIPKGIMYPVVGAFRALIIKDTETQKLTWKIDPFKAWEVKKEFIVNTVLENSANFGNSPDSIGKSSLIWDSLFNQMLLLSYTYKE